VAAVVALECGWIVTEVGRQPWIVHQRLRTAEAVTTAGGIWWTLIVVLALYAGLAVATVLALRTMARRWRERAEDEADVPYGPPVAAS
jgi:cytochrome d ubiquinol oxidase subunit I